MPTRPLSRSGFTLVELIVTCLMIGILAAIAIPQYLKTVEVTKADDAVATVNMIGTTNRMFALDHNGYYVNGQFTASCTGTCTGGGACPTSVSATVTNACALVCCNYLADQNWATKPYNFYACDGKVASACGSTGSSTRVAGACRKGTTCAGTPAAMPGSIYDTWSFLMTTAGTISANGTNPPTPVY
ncbi:MAG: hypothetical protein A2V88_16255 [Elusimicrobia bacterium RBG_16_66_12]|nr:MAG: hypothetical protein A2V88_16255 [Elusimicrobia bacterium RBG_16_66_12]